jgi:hypothetical protein
LEAGEMFEILILANLGIIFFGRHFFIEIYSGIANIFPGLDVGGCLLHWRFKV